MSDAQNTAAPRRKRSSGRARRGTSMSFTEFRVFNGALRNMTFEQAVQFDPTITRKQFDMMQARFAKVVSSLPTAGAGNAPAYAALDPEHAELAQASTASSNNVAASFVGTYSA